MLRQFYIADSSLIKTEFQRPRFNLRCKRLQFTWVSAYTQDDSTVTLDFTPNGSGTDLRLTHVRFPHEESRDNHEGGWTRILEALDQFLT